MRAANGRHVYRKLRKLYGNSFNSVIGHHSLHVVMQDNPVKEEYLAGMLELEDLEVVEPETELCFNDNPSFDEINDAGFHYLTEGYIYPEEYSSSSQKVQRQIELLAQKVTRSIIDSKTLDE